MGGRVKQNASPGSICSMSWWIAALDPEGSADKGLRVSTEIYYDRLMVPTRARLWGTVGAWGMAPALKAGP